MRSVASRRSLPPDVYWWVPEPTVFLTGPNPLIPPHELARRGEQSCPLCSGAVRDRLDHVGDGISTRLEPTIVYCLQCDGMDPRHEPRLEHQRIETGAIETERQQAADDAEALESAISRADGIQLTELERRRIWLGNQPITSDLEREPNNLARMGREFLRAIDQLPDFSIELDRRGRMKRPKHVSIQDVDDLALCRPGDLA